MAPPRIRKVFSGFAPDLQIDLKGPCICQLYEEEQNGKVREGRKVVPSSKMPDLGWDIAETQLQTNCRKVEVQENAEINDSVTTLPLQALIAIAVIITAILEYIIAYVKEIPEAASKATQVVKSTTTKISHNKLFQNIKKSYKTAVLAITIATNTMNHTSRMNQHQTANRNTLKKYDGSYRSHTSRTHNDIRN